MSAPALRSCLWLLLLIAAWGCESERLPAERRMPTATASPGRSTEDKPNPANASGTSSWHEAAGLRVLEVELGAAHDASLPMVVFIHGRGDHANPGWIEGLDTPARYVFPQAPIPFGDGFSWFEFSADAEPSKLASDMSRAEAQMIRALTQLATDRPTLGKPIVCGFSQGGMLAYALALGHPESIAFALPISGMLPAPLYEHVPAAGQRYPPIRALHGKRDSVVPYAPTAQMVEALRGRKLDIALSSFDDADHEITPRMRKQMLSLVRTAIAQARTQKPADVPR